MPEKFYLTTPIYYVNARPHIGHAYTTIVADVLARRSRAQGNDTWFLTGTDEHGQKIERSALAAGVPPQIFTDEVSATFQTLWRRMGITNDQFIRTTSEAHKRGVQKLFTDLYAKGEIYLSTYTGQYSIGEEMFVEGPPGTIGPDGRPTETVTEENFFFKLSEYQERLLKLIESNTLKITPASSRNEVLSFLRGNVAAVIQETVNKMEGPPDTGAAERRAVEDGTLRETSSGDEGDFYVPGALRDLSVSRSSFTWGIPVPKEILAKEQTTQNHVIYVWLDALTNYMTAVGYGDDSEEAQAKFARYWPADLHLVGKEITRFHCVYWPAFLMAAGLPLPKAITAHGWLLFDDSKMSKSKGNIVRTETILDAFGTLCPPPATSSLPHPTPAPLSSRSEAEGPASPIPALEPTKAHRDLFAADVLRYYLLREIPFGQDGSFTFEALITRYNADLANGYANLVKRALTMIEKNFGSSFGDELGEMASKGSFLSTSPDFILPRNMIDKTINHIFFNNLESYSFSNELEATSACITSVDKYFSDQAPWKLAVSVHHADREKLAEILYLTTDAIRIITALLYPILPFATAKVWKQLGFDKPIKQSAEDGDLKHLTWGGLQPGTKLGPLSPIFPRADKGLAQTMSDMEQEKTLTAVTAQNDASTPAASDLPTAPVSSFVDEKFNTSPETQQDPTHPAAPPRSFGEATTVAGSNAHTTERAGTPPHTEAQASGIFTTPLEDPARAASTPQITIDDFIKIELRVAQILVCERIPKADKLLRLEVDLGYERRQILSGIAEWYTPEELIGRRIVVITNLAPRKMRGLESHGMLLAASAEPSAEGEKPGKPHLATFTGADDLPLGSRLR